MTPNPNTNPDEVIFKTGTTVSDAPSWLDSLRRQIRELREERKHPQQKVKITAQRDPSALNNLVEMPSPVLSLFSDMREAINEVGRVLANSGKAVYVVGENTVRGTYIRNSTVVCRGPTERRRAGNIPASDPDTAPRPSTVSRAMPSQTKAPRPRHRRWRESAPTPIQLSRAQGSLESARTRA